MRWQGVMSLLRCLDCRFLFDTMETKDKIENFEGEVWKDIVGCNGIYQISNKGRVKSRNFYNKKCEMILKPCACDGRYLSIIIDRGAGRKHYMIHRLVYEHFVGELPNYERNAPSDKQYVINHIDENKLNNNADNLELLTCKDNINYGTHNLRISKSMTNGPTSKKVYQYTKNHVLVRVWPSIAECGRCGYNFGHIASCCRNSYGKNSNYYKGYIWSYKLLNI